MLHAKNHAFGNTTTQLLMAIAVMMLQAGIGHAEMAVIDFEDQDALITQPGEGIITGGFGFQPVLVPDSGNNHLHITNDETGRASNGTFHGGTHGDARLIAPEGVTFDAFQFDYAGHQQDGEFDFDVTGTFANSTTTTQTFSPDGIVDGAGGDLDFQTFELNNTFRNLVSLEWSYDVSQQVEEIRQFTVDNIVIPEPSTLSVLLLGGVVLVRRRRH